MSRAPTRVLIAGDLFGFPHGTGATTRVLTIARGLLAAGADVRVLVTRYTERDPATAVNHEARGVFEGVPFEYSTGTTVRPSGFAQRRLAPAKGILGAVGPIVSLEGEPPDAVLLFVGHTLALPIMTRLATMSRGSVLLFDGCEKPYVYEQGSPARRLEERVYTTVMYRLYDGVFAISDYLVRYFAPRLRAGAQIMQVPILVDVDRFTPAKSAARHSCPRYIAYTGALGESKGVHLLIRAFASLADEFPDLRLRLSGAPSPRSYTDGLARLASALGVADRVESVGVVPYDNYPRLLQGADALVVPHPRGEFSEAAFPTKLGEYLASGTPTVATRVGEIDRFVADGVDLYFAPPDDPFGLAQRLRHVLLHPDEAALVGAKGRATARKHFDYRVHGRRLLLFIDDLRAARKGGIT
ncbi:MAG TPA: glycosyltransferase family 4 protein [Gemmatimonadaceae bacterium]